MCVYHSGFHAVCIWRADYYNLPFPVLWARGEGGFGWMEKAYVILWGEEGEGISHWAFFPWYSLQLWGWCMYMKMIILFGSDVTVDSSVEAVMMHSLNSIFTCVVTVSRLRVCAGYVPPYMIKHCTVGCFVLCGAWLRIPLKHSSLRAALCKYQQSTCIHTQMIAYMALSL